MAKKKRIRLKKKPRRASAASSGCGYSVRWSLLKSIAGMTAIWIPDREYKKVAASFLTKTKGQYARRMLRQRMAPIGVSIKCGGTCEGGWCKEVILIDTPDVQHARCECQYFV
jgi:hypothetical protein